MKNLLYLVILMASELSHARPSPDDAYEGGDFTLWLPIATTIAGYFIFSKYFENKFGKWSGRVGALVGLAVGSALLYFFYKYVLLLMCIAWILGCIFFTIGKFSEGEIAEGFGSLLFPTGPSVLFGIPITWYFVKNYF